jgi:hypothetical protein
MEDGEPCKNRVRTSFVDSSEFLCSRHVQFHADCLCVMIVFKLFPAFVFLNIVFTFWFLILFIWSARRPSKIFRILLGIYPFCPKGPLHSWAASVLEKVGAGYISWIWSKKKQAAHGLISGRRILGKMCKRRRVDFYVGAAKDWLGIFACAHSSMHTRRNDLGSSIPFVEMINTRYHYDGSAKG